MYRQLRLDKLLVGMVLLTFVAMSFQAMAQDPIEIFADSVGASPGEQNIAVPICANNIPEPPADWYDGNGDFDEDAFEAWITANATTGNPDPQKDEAVFAIEFTIEFDPAILEAVMVDLDDDGNPDAPEVHLGDDVPENDLGDGSDWGLQANIQPSGETAGWEEIHVAMAGSEPLNPESVLDIAEIIFNVKDEASLPPDTECTEIHVRNLDGGFMGMINEGQFAAEPENYEDPDQDPSDDVDNTDIGEVCIGISSPFTFTTTSTICNFYGTVKVVVPGGDDQLEDADVGDYVAAFVDSVEVNDGCIGAFEVETVGSYGLLAAYGDDTTTGEIKDGAADDDTVTFKIWDSSEDTIYDAVIVGGSGSDAWTSGTSQEVNIEAEPPVPPQMKLYLAEGWNLISWTTAKCYYQDSEPTAPLPAGTELIDIADGGHASMSEWFSSILVPNNQIADSWRIVIGALPGGAAKTIDSTVPAPFHTLKFMGPGYGYWVKLNDGTGGGTITLEGENVASDADITLEEGWNLPGYLPTVCYHDSADAPADGILYVRRTDDPPCPSQDEKKDAPVTNHVLSSIDGDWRIVIGARPGGTAITADPTVPEPFWSLHDFCPGNGYWIKMSDGTGGGTLSYPSLNPMSEPLAVAPDIQQHISPTSKVTPTNTSMFIYGTVNIDNIPAPVGSEILVQTSTGFLCGEGKVARPGEYNLLPIYGDDPTTDEVDGALVGDELHIIVNGSVTDTVLPVRWLGDRTVQPIDLTIRTIPKETFLGQNYPNPFNPETWIPYALSAPADVTVKIYNLQGQLIRKIDLDHRKAGTYQTKERAAYWDGRNESGERVSSGLYFYELHTGEFSQVKRMVILK